MLRDRGNRINAPISIFRFCCKLLLRTVRRTLRQTLAATAAVASRSLLLLSAACVHPFKFCYIGWNRSGMWVSIWERCVSIYDSAATATSATLPCPISRLGSWAISVIILSFQLVCKIPATLQCQLQLFSRALIKAWQFYSAQQLYSYCATGQLRLSHNLLTLYLIWICRSIDRSWHTEATARTHCSAIMRSYIFMHGTYSMQYAECRMKLNPAD